MRKQIVTANRWLKANGYKRIDTWRIIPEFEYALCYVYSPQLGMVDTLAKQLTGKLVTIAASTGQITLQVLSAITTEHIPVKD